MSFYREKKFADDLEHDGWDQETGMPTLMMVANAIQVWSTFQPAQTSVKECADAFNLDYSQVRAAVEAHLWMYLSGPDDDPGRQIIEHEGE